MRKIIKSKKGISIMIGYVLLVSFALIMSIVIYNWIKSYAPRDSPKCVDGASIFIKDYECTSSYLNLTIKNSGRFDFGGYFIRISDNETRELAITDISDKIVEGGTNIDNIVRFSSLQENPFKTNEERSGGFDISSFEHVYLVEIVPIRFQPEGNKLRLISCANAKAKAEVNC